jgi:hypothetical protein
MKFLRVIIWHIYMINLDWLFWNDT